MRTKPIRSPVFSPTRVFRESVSPSFPTYLKNTSSTAHTASERAASQVYSLSYLFPSHPTSLPLSYITPPLKLDLFILSCNFSPSPTLILLPMANPNQERNPSASSLPLISSTSRSSSSGASGITSTSSTMHRATGRIAISHRNNPNAGIYNEQVLILVFRCLNWDPQTLCSTACTSRRHRAVAERILFYQLCLSRAPQLVSTILRTPINVLPHGIGASAPRLPGGWPALAKILLYCCGCNPSLFFALSNPVPGHFTPITRFSKTSGKSFLVRRCWGDVLYVSDPCEHASPPGEDHDLGVYR